ncbi:hypothetical protein [uncultured Thomasclavelia sp.]|uniref:hypothetical protein n=1 Tax=uncultured Thomasclavelia sp. TaxID=3025759 RepID=UPI0025FF3FF5|nr:hypothetical protein [uncultured Thomasclavelia sp.]
MKKLIKLLLVFVLGFCLIGCKEEKHEYSETYTLYYFYLEGCPNCEHFTENGLPKVEEEFGNHMQIIEYDMDNRETINEVKAAYDAIVNNIIDFDQDDYGFGPFLVLDGYYAQLGVSDVDKYVDNLIAAVTGEDLTEPGENETYYYFNDGKVQP